LPVEEKYFGKALKAAKMTENTREMTLNVVKNLHKLEAGVLKMGWLTFSLFCLCCFCIGYVVGYTFSDYKR
jgi:hypothetical protein